MIGVQHRLEGGHERALWIGQEVRDARERFVLFDVKDMEDGADKERMARLLPMVAALERAIRIDQDVGDALRVPDLTCAPAYLKQRIIMGGADIRRIEQETVGEACPPSRRDAPVFTLDVMHEDRAGPAEQGRNNQADALAASCRSDGEDVLGPFMTQIGAAELAEEDAIAPEQPGTVNVASG